MAEIGHETKELRIIIYGLRCIRLDIVDIFL